MLVLLVQGFEEKACDSQAGVWGIPEKLVKLVV